MSCLFPETLWSGKFKHLHFFQWIQFLTLTDFGWSKQILQKIFKAGLGHAVCRSKTASVANYRVTGTVLRGERGLKKNPRIRSIVAGGRRLQNSESPCKVISFWEGVILLCQIRSRWDTSIFYMPQAWHIRGAQLYKSHPYFYYSVRSHSCAQVPWCQRRFWIRLKG